MSFLRPLRIVLALVFCLTVSFGGASRAEDEDAPAAPAAGSPETDAESEADPADESEADPVDDPDAEFYERTTATPPKDDVEELFVTATKREEALQDVPISMSALNASFLDDSGITQFGQISEYVPNLKINPMTDTRGTVMRIRGIGSAGNNAGIDPSVGLFIDGVYQGRAGMSIGDLLDIERVEVLRGPQGTLYGKNTAAGLINIISKRPVYEWEAIAEAVYGNYGNYETRTSVNFPIVDEHIAGRFSGYWVTRDGFDKRLDVAGRKYGPPASVPPVPNILPDNYPWATPATAPNDPFTPEGPDGDDRFIFEDDRVNDDNKWGTKGRLLFDLTDSLSFLVTGDYSFVDTKCCVADILSFEGFPTLSTRELPVGPAVLDGPTAIQGVLTFQNLANYWVTRPFETRPSGTFQGRPFQGTGIPLPHDDPFDNVVMADVDPTNEVAIGGVALDGTYEFPEMPVLGDSVLNLIASWRTYTNHSLFDGDFSYYEVAQWGTDVDLDQYSVELRLTSPGGELVDYQTGFYFYHQEMHTVDQLEFFWDAINLFPLFDGASGPTRNVGDNTHKTWSYAGFGQVTLNPLDQLSLTGGLRVTHEKKTRVGEQTCHAFRLSDGEWQWVLEERPLFDTPPICGLSASIAPGENERSVTNVSGMANLRYFPTEDVMLYASFATGFKSGGFNQLRVTVGTPTEFNDEESMNFEGGFKTSWFDRMLTLNVTGFYTEYDEFQAQLFDGISINVRNAGSLESYGAEGDLMLVPAEWAPGLVLGSSVGFNIAEYTDFDNGEQTAAQRWDATGGFVLAGCGPPAPVENCVQDLAGKRLDSAPRWSISSFVQYEFLLPWLPLELFARAEYAYTSMQFLAQDLDPGLKQPATHIVNLRAGFRAEDRAWEVTGWVRNLTDEEYNVVGFDVPTINGFAGINGPPRQYGMTVRLNF
jgi:iron complex outermembrane receptor protein